MFSLTPEEWIAVALSLRIAVVATVVCPSGNTPDHFKQKLSEMPTLSHVTVEVLEPKR